MGLENDLYQPFNEVGEQEAYLPFAVQYLENPEPRGHDMSQPLDYTSATFCTFKLIPLIDDGD